MSAEPAGPCAYCAKPLLRVDHKGGMLCHRTPREAANCMKDRRPAGAPMAVRAAR